MQCFGCVRCSGVSIKYGYLLQKLNSWMFACIHISTCMLVSIGFFLLGGGGGLECIGGKFPPPGTLTWVYLQLISVLWTSITHSPATSYLVNCFIVAQVLINCMLETAGKTQGSLWMTITAMLQKWPRLTYLLWNQCLCHRRWQESCWGVRQGTYGPESSK